MAAALPRNAATQEPPPAELEAIRSGAFLDTYVQRALAAGAAPYVPPEARGHAGAGAANKGLRFEAYEPAPARHSALPPGPALASTSVGGGGGGAMAADPFGMMDYGGSGVAAAGVGGSGGGSGRTSGSGMGPRGGSMGDLSAAGAGPSLTLKNTGARK